MSAYAAILTGSPRRVLDLRSIADLVQRVPYIPHPHSFINTLRWYDTLVIINEPTLIHYY